MYQRKLKQSLWEDIRDTPLTKLKAGEGYLLELRSAEVSKLLRGLLSRRNLYEQHGISFGSHQYVSRDDLPRVVREIVDFPESELADALAQLGAEDVLTLGRKVDLSRLEAALHAWQSNLSNDDEDFWQQLLSRESWIFSQLTGSPVVLVRSKAYVGGKSIANVGGGQVDYLCKNDLTSNVSLVEIKTPLTPICGAEYRTSGSFSIHREVTGGIVQVLGYKETLDKEFYALQQRTATEITAYNPQCYLIAGCASALTASQLRSFELFRNSLTDLRLVTFDEVLRRLQGIRDALRS